MGVVARAMVRPGFREHAFGNMTERIGLMKHLIDRFNSMLKGIAAMTEFSHVIYINLRNTLSRGANYKQYWRTSFIPQKRVSSSLPTVLSRCSISCWRTETSYRAETERNLGRFGTPECDCHATYLRTRKPSAPC